VTPGGLSIPPVARSRDELDTLLAGWRDAGESVALVPTMGALHEGHLHLVDQALAGSDRVLMSIFVNPLQFGPGEDLAAYPRDLDRDVELAAGRGIHAVFAPEVEVMYPGGEPRVTVDPGPAGDRLCGAFRPGHFRGVLTVVAKLLGLVRPDRAHFGRKDYQQAVLIRRMVRELEMGTEIRVEALIREADGLAMSSRNRYLTSEERDQALGLSRGLFAAREAFEAGERSPDRVRARVEDEVGRYAGLRLQYAEAVDPDTLEPVDELASGQVVAAAAFAGETRLIDNVVLGGEGP
jgi:pantoate--beta-alanine ligase